MSIIAGVTVEFPFFDIFPESNLPSALPQTHYVLGEQKQPGDRDVSDVDPGSSGPEQPEVNGSRGGELWGAASPAGHLRQQRHPEAAAAATGCGSARHPP